VLVLAPILSFIEPENDVDKVRKIIIDAGHGGRDPGNLGTGRYRTTEKHVALEVSLLVGKYLEENLEDVEIIYTRDDDRFLELWERTSLANRAEGDLFVSIHCNSVASASAYGVETYTIGMHKDETQFEVAKKENSVILLEEDYNVKYDGFNPNDPDHLIGLSLTQSAFQEQSRDLAAKIQYQFRERVQRRDRGVKQAGFYVISRTIMPSVLVELGFLSNPKEEDFLQSRQGKEYLASAIYRAIKEFKIEREKGGLPVSEIHEGELDSDQVVIPDAEALAANVETEDPAVAVDPDRVIFKVQLESSSRSKELVSSNFRGLDKIDFYREHGLYKYTYGATNDLDEAREMRRYATQVGYRDAFLVAFLNGERIGISEAIKLSK
jgi:N-acetylmuramoyl-L-alanine amidase